MGNSHPYQGLKQEDYEHKICAICYASNDFRVLKCGHAFCKECLSASRNAHEGHIVCPYDREQDHSGVDSLPTPSEFPDKVIIPSFDDADEDLNSPSFKKSLSRSLNCRWDTIEALRNTATEIASLEETSNKVQIGGSSVSLAGGVLITGGLVLSLTGVGGVVGVPLALSGAIIGGGGALGNLAMNVAEMVIRNINVKAVNEKLRLDNFRSEQLIIMIKRAEVDTEVAISWDLNYLSGVGVACAVPSTIRAGVSAVASLRMMTVATRTTGSTVLHGVGIFLGAAMIPVDIGQLIYHSIKVYRKSTSDIVQDIRNLADALDCQLKLFYLQYKFFTLLTCQDVKGQTHWAYICIDPMYFEEFVCSQDLSPIELRLEDLASWGRVIVSGIGEQPPDHVQEMILHEWTSLTMPEHDFEHLTSDDVHHPKSSEATGQDSGHTNDGGPSTHGDT